jgi:hypothetical protein
MIEALPADGGCSVVWEAKVRQLRQKKRKALHGESAGTARSRPNTILGPVPCVACGGAIADVLSRLGSTRCHDCRDGVQPGELVDSVPADGTARPELSPARAFLVRVRGRQRRLRRTADRPLRG